MCPIIVMMTFILGQMPGELLQLIQLGGGCLLLYIAQGALNQFQAGTALDAVTAQRAGDADGTRRILLTGIMMNFLSPGPWLFWADGERSSFCEGARHIRLERAGVPGGFLRHLSERSMWLGALIFTMRERYVPNTCAM